MQAVSGGLGDFPAERLFAGFNQSLMMLVDADV